MKEKLEMIREALKTGNFTYLGGEATVCIKPIPYKEAKALLDSLIVELESPELVERVAEDLIAYATRVNKNINPENDKPITLQVPYFYMAQAAINAIKGI